MTARTGLSLLSVLLTVLPAGGETFAELERRAAEQERQIRQLEVQNQRLRDQIERLQERLDQQADLAAAAEEPATPPAVPAPAAPGESAPPAADREETAVHIVRAGENLSKIARQHGTTTEILAKLNGIRNPGLIRQGQKLKLPAGDGRPAVASDAEKVLGTHKVKRGETFFSIARIYGLSAEALAAANPDVDPKALRIGQELRLSARKAGESAPAPETDRESAPRTDNSTSRNPSGRPAIRSIPIDENISFGEFARIHNMDPAKLNALNGLQLEPRTVLATGSRLYVSAQPLE